MSSRPRVYVGHLSHRARESDVDRFFRGYGKVSDIMLKNGFGFVEFDDIRDAEDAIHELNGRDLCGERVMLEIARGTPRGAGGAFVSGYVPPMQSRSRDSRSSYGRYSSGDRPRDSDRDKFRNRNGSSSGGYGGGRPTANGYRVIVENLSSRVTWQDLKDLMRPYGEVTFADAHHYRRNEGVVEYTCKEDVKEAVEQLDGKEINGRNIHLVPDLPRSSRSKSKSLSRSVSRSRSPSRDRRRSKRSRSKSSQHSFEPARSRSPLERNGRSHSRHSESPPPKKKSSRSRSNDVRETRSRTPQTPQRSGSSRSRSP